MRVVLGGLDDVALIKEEAFKADIVIHTADCDHLPRYFLLLFSHSPPPFSPCFSLYAGMASGAGDAAIRVSQSDIMIRAADC